MTHHTRPAIPAVLLLSLLLAGCGGGDTPRTATPAAVTPGTANPTAAPQTNPTANPNAELLRQAVANMAAMKSYHIENVGNVGGTATSLIGDFDVAGGRYKFTEQYSGAGPSQQYQIIILGNDRYEQNLIAANASYIHDSSGKSDPAASSLTQMWVSIKPADLDKAALNFMVGDPASESIDGADTRHFTAPGDSLPSLNFIPNPITSTVELWISTDTNPTVRQMRLSGQIKADAATGNAAANSGFKVVVKWSNFNANFNIQPPVTGN